MAPIKFEEKLQEKLEKRRLEPSEDSWDRLSARLDANNNSQKNNRYWWAGLAASIILLFSVGIGYYFQNEKNENVPQVVEVDKPIKSDAGSSQSEIEHTKPDQQMIMPKSTDVVSYTKTDSNNVILKVQNNSMEPNLNKLKSLPSQNLKTDLVVDNHNRKTVLNELTAQEIKVKEVVADIIRLQNENETISNKEIDSLLKSAQKQLLDKRIYNEKDRVVNAEDLLHDVETELEDSFREKVFDALKSSYETVKTAVAQRNN